MSSVRTTPRVGARPSTRFSPKIACSTSPGASTVAATRSIASRARSRLLTLTFDISQLPGPRNWVMAGGSNGYRAALVKRQLTPGLISSLPRAAGSPPFISFSTSCRELDSAVRRPMLSDPIWFGGQVVNALLYCVGSRETDPLPQIAAVGDVDHRAVQDDRRVEGEPADGLGDFFRPPGAPGIGIPHELLDALRLRFPEQLGFHRSRRHRVHLDAVRAQIRCKTAGEADDPGLRHAVPEVGVRREGGDRRHTDDAAALSPDHLLREGADQLHRRFEVDAQDTPARFVRIAVDRDRGLHAGVVDK